MHLIVVSNEVKKIAQKYKLPIYIIAGVKGSSERIAKAYTLAHNREYFEIHQAIHDEIELLGRPTAFRARKIKKEDRDIVILQLSFPTVTVQKSMDYEEFKKFSTEEWIRKLTDWVYVKAHRKKVRVKDKEMDKWFADKIGFVRINVDRESFVRRIQKLIDAGIEIPVLGTWAELIGFPLYSTLFDGENSALLQLLLAVYTIPLVATEPVHEVIFTEPGAGKTTTAIVYKEYLKWEYYNEIPSTATLVGDARTGRSRIAGAKGIWFDEVDKWFARKKKTNDVAELLEVILTGMEQGLWKRGKGGEKTIEVQNEIPVIFSGNDKFGFHPREKLMKLIATVDADASEAINDRIGVAVTIRADIGKIVPNRTWDAITKRVVIGKPSVMRGAVEVMQEWYIDAPEPRENPFKGRHARYFKRVYKAIHVLFAKNPMKKQWANEDLVHLLAKHLVHGLLVNKIEDLQNLT